MDNINYLDMKPLVIRNNRLFPVIKNKTKKLERGCVVIDVGAHSGFMTNLFSKIVGPRGRVISFEPNFYFIPHCMNRYRLRKNVSIYPFALSNKLEIVKVAYNHKLPEGCTLFEKISYGEKDKYPIDILIDSIGISLDLLEKELNIDRLDFIWMNCEGYEINVLIGARETIEKYKPDILISSHILLDDTCTKYKCKEILEDMGYKVEFLKERDSYVFATYNKDDS